LGGHDGLFGAPRQEDGLGSLINILMQLLLLLLLENEVSLVKLHLEDRQGQSLVLITRRKG